MKRNNLIVNSLIIFLGLAVQCNEKPTENSPEKYDTKRLSESKGGVELTRFTTAIKN